MQNSFYRKDLKFPLHIRLSSLEYEYIHHVAISLNKPVATVVRDMIEKEITTNGYKTTSSVHNLEYSTISETEITGVN